MSEKLNANQERVLRRLSIGPLWPMGRDISTARALVRRGLAYDEHNVSFCIAPAGRAALSKDGERT